MYMSEANVEKKKKDTSNKDIYDILRFMSRFSTKQ